MPLCPPSSGGAQHPAEAHPVTVAGPGGSQVHAVGTDEPGEGDEAGGGDRVCPPGRGKEIRYCRQAAFLTSLSHPFPG